MQLQTWFTVLRMAILQHRLYSRLYSNLSNGWNLIRKINVCDYVANASVDQLTRLGDFSMGYFTSSLCVWWCATSPKLHLLKGNRDIVSL